MRIRSLFALMTSKISHVPWLVMISSSGCSPQVADAVSECAGMGSDRSWLASATFEPIRKKFPYHGKFRPLISALSAVQSRHHPRWTFRRHLFIAIPCTGSSAPRACWPAWATREEEFRPFFSLFARKIIFSDVEIIY